MSGKFYEWNGSTLVLDPGVFAWDLPRRGADWQVGYFPRDGMGAEPTVTSELEEAGAHLVGAATAAARAGETAVLDVEPVITKAPDRFVDYAMQHPWMTLLFGASLGVFLTMYVQKRRRMTKNPVGDYGTMLEQMDDALTRRDAKVVGRLADVLRFRYGMHYHDIYNIFKKAHPSLTVAEYDALLEESEELESR